MQNDIDIFIEVGEAKNIPVELEKVVDYEKIENKPNINGVELVGDKTAKELGIIVPIKTSELENDSGYLTKHQDISGKADKENTYTKTEIDSTIGDINSILDNINGEEL